MPGKLILLGQYPPTVVLDPGQNLLEALLALDQRGVRHAVVVDSDGRLQGILSIRRILSFIERRLASGGVYEGLKQTRVADVMWHNPPRVVLGEFGIEDVIYILSRLNVGAITVVDKDERVLGIISEKHITGIMALAEIHVAVHEVMTKPAKSLSTGSKLREAIELMAIHRHRHIPIVGDGGRVAAMLTARDVLDYIALETTLDKLAEGLDEEVFNTPVTHVATGAPATVEPEADVSKALRLMRKRGISGLPVVNRDGELEGIITERDIVIKMPKLVGTELFYDYARSRLYVARVVF
ncbi:CBS domain-containing protein [Pyrodictium abyssi]|uniref:CBS domain-containing protein n=1 Tax=Pyrodictium abyssi TaxID=54256 RepID=A0ABM8IUI9_9CREN|nr:CBS domain-containing protein [Pyrodictium abyssi]